MNECPNKSKHTQDEEPQRQVQSFAQREWRTAVVVLARVECLRWVFSVSIDLKCSLVKSRVYALSKILQNDIRPLPPHSTHIQSTLGKKEMDLTILPQRFAFFYLSLLFIPIHDLCAGDEVP